MSATPRDRFPAAAAAALALTAMLASIGPAGAGTPLPRWGGATPPKRGAPARLTPFSAAPAPGRSAPAAATVRTPAEYEPVAGVLFQFDRWGWPDLVADMVAALTADAGGEEIAWVLVASPQQQHRAESLFDDAGADMSRVVFIEMPTETIWVRDWGPQFVWLDGTLAIVDNRYFTSRPNDNFVPRRLAEEYFLVPSYEPGLWHFGGNLLVSADGQGFTTSIVDTSNPAYGIDLVADRFATYQGVGTLHVFPALPSSVDATGHIDMWLQLVDADTAVVSRFPPGSDAAAIAITDNAAAYMEQVLGYEVFRLPAHNGPHPWAAGTHFTYTNAFRVNDRIFVPTYASGDPSLAADDATALATWQAAAPDAQIVPIDAWDIVYAAGVLHCTMIQVPRYTASAPSARVIAPAGGELLVPGDPWRIEWSASDDEGIASVDLSVTVDGGAGWSPLAIGLPNTRFHDAVVPAAIGSRGRVRVVAVDGTANTGEAESAAEFTIVDAVHHVYDFASGAGTVHHAWGHHVADWNDVAGRRRPAALATELTAEEYLALAASDATGDDGDPGRFRSPVPPTGSHAAHVFEFTIEEPAVLIREIEIAEEGYGDSCQQVELYVWDRVAGEWCDGAGSCGQKRSLDLASGNRDVSMRGTLRQDLDRYLDDAGRLTLLAITAGTVEEILYDSLAVTVTHVGHIDTDLDGFADLLDCAPADAGTWSVPGEADGLLPASDPAGTRFDWSAPLDGGGQQVTYDLLASSSPAFDLAACVAHGVAATTAIDATADPAPGALHRYLVRAVNDCGAGDLGAGSTGISRVGPACP